MLELSNIQTFGEISWDSGEIKTEKQNIKDIIYNADHFLLTDIFKFYKLNFDHNLNKMRCPFSFHSEGKEKTPSFKYYPESNTFFCFGCKTAGRSSDFVSKYEKIDKVLAANKILSLNFSRIDNLQANDYYSEQCKLYLKFSNIIYDFYSKNKEPGDIKFIEDIAFLFDKLNAKYDLKPDALNSLITKLELQINIYICKKH